MVNDKNLICFFSWGRTELTKKSFENLLENVRPQDKLLVVDNEMLNFDLYAKHRDKIDFLTFFKLNYHIGPVWMYIYNLVHWQRDKRETYRDLNKRRGVKKNIQEKNKIEDPERYWYPDYINIVESDTLGKKGWIDRVLEVFQLDATVGIASGFDSKNVGVKSKNGKVLLKDTVCGVNAIFKTEHFLSVAHYFERTGQDKHVSIRNRHLGKMVGIIPDEITHIGEDDSFRKIF